MTPSARHLFDDIILDDPGVCNKDVIRPENVSHYPNPKTDFIQDEPMEDSGNNYGRFRSRLIASLPPHPSRNTYSK